jgi:hypothetical protein
MNTVNQINVDALNLKIKLINNQTNNQSSYEHHN